MSVTKCCSGAVILSLLYLNSFSQNAHKINSAEIIKQGEELYGKDKFKEAIALYKKVPRSDTNYNNILYDLSLTTYSDSNYTESIKLCEEGLKYYPERADDWYNLIANCLDEQGKQMEAI